MGGVLEGLVDLPVHHNLNALVLLDTEISVLDLFVDPFFKRLTDHGGGNITDPRLGQIPSVTVVRIVFLDRGELPEERPDLGKGEALIGRHHEGSDVSLEDV